MVDAPRRSFRTLNIIVVAMFVLLAGGLYKVQIADGSKYKQLAQGNRERVLSIKANRGIIYDRDGERLVVNNPSYSVAVTPADLADINCATGNLEGSKTFEELARIVGSTDVIVVKPADLPAEKVGEVANRLSVLLDVHADHLRGPLRKIMEERAGSQSYINLRTDISAEASARVRAQLDNLPGVKVYNELELNFITRYDKCLKPVTVMSGIDYNTMQLVETSNSRIPGVTINPEPVRQYVDGSLFSHILGYVGSITRDEYEESKAEYEPDDKVGKTGIEAALEEQLRGQKGAASVMVNSKERAVNEIASSPAITGNNVTLTIDADLQRSVAAALQDGLTKAKVKAGVAVVMRVDNGQVLSMVSLPSYDNNLFSTGISQADFDRLNTDPAHPMFHRAIGGAYPPGSTYKMITAAAALQEGVVAPDTVYACPGYIQVPFTWDETKGNRFRDWKAQGHGNINIIDALTVSSDVFFYIVAGPRQEDRKIIKDDGTEEVVWTRFYRPGARTPSEFNGLGIERLNRYAEAFGLGKRTGIEIPGEVAGLSPQPRWKIEFEPDNPWSIGDTLVTAIGQGYNLMTPLQLANVTAAVANGGTLYKPKVVLNTSDPLGNTLQEYQPEVLGTIPVSPENLALVREGMRQVVANKAKGTAYHRMTLRSIEVAGKTGTAEYGEKIADKDGKEIRRSHAWFTAFAPFNKPEIAVVVLLEGGEESLEGSTFAVPVTDAILKAYFKVDK